MKLARHKTMMLAAAFATSLACAFSSQASVVIASTRVVYPANEREVTVKLTNEGKAPVLVQTWIDDGNIIESPSQINVPFTLTPPIFRMDPGKGQSLRLSYTKQPLPKDKESLFWLNVLEAPPKNKMNSETNTLEMALRTRIKVLFRPQGLPGEASGAPAQTKWEIIRHGNAFALKASNPTPYYVNLGKVTLTAGGKTFDAGQGYIAPSGTELFPVKGLESMPSGAEVDYTSINDDGRGVEGKQAVASAAP